MQSTITDDGTGTGQSLIGSINDALERRIGRQRFRIWFKNSTRLALADGFVKVGVANLFIAGWIENHFGSEIIEAVRSVTGKSARITFGVDPELSGNQRRRHRLAGPVTPGWAPVAGTRTRRIEDAEAPVGYICGRTVQ